MWNTSWHLQIQQILTILPVKLVTCSKMISRILDSFSVRKIIKYRNCTLDEQVRECTKAYYHVKHWQSVREKSTENRDVQREQGRRSYRKTVSTTWLNMKPRTVHHYTSKPESFVAIDHFWNQQWYIDKRGEESDYQQRCWFGRTYAMFSAACHLPCILDVQPEPRGEYPANHSPHEVELFPKIWSH